LTTRQISFRIAFEETLFFLRGETQTKLLEEKKIGIWRDNTSREFLDERGLGHIEAGDMGKGYGYQIRNFGGTGHDQLATLLAGLANNPTGRRHVITHWCPNQLHEAALPPCHLLHMYSVKNGRLDSSFVMRSSDLYHGLPYNIMSYALMNHIFASHLGLAPGELVYFGHDVHVYETHTRAVETQMSREPKQLPQLIIKKALPTIDDIMSLDYADCNLIDYNPHPALPKVDMAI